jgi:hypothetical protein
VENNNQFLEVSQRVIRAKEYVKDWMSNIDKWRSLYDMKNAKEPNSYSDPTHTNAVDLVVGIMLANKIRWHAYGFAPSYKEQQDTGKIEKLVQATWDANDHREERSNSFELIMNFGRDGGAVIYSVFDPELAKQYRTEIEEIDERSDTGTRITPAFRETPVRIQVIDPRKFFMLPGGPHRWLLMGRREEMSVLDVMLSYPGANFDRYMAMSDEDKSMTKGEFCDVWDYVTVTNETGEKSLAVRNTVIFDGIPLMGPRIMNGYKELPYKVQFYKPTGSEPGKWQNIMSAQESSVELLEKTINRRSKQIDIFTALPLVSKTQVGRVVQVDAGLFNHVSLGPDESIEFPRWQGNPPEVQLHIDFLRSRVNQSGFSEVMFGIGSGDAAGYAVSQLSDQNRIRLEQPIYHLELLLTAWARHMMDMLNTFAAGHAICAYGQHKGKDFNEYVHVDDFEGYSVKAEVRPSFPAEEQRKVAMATQSKGILSNYTIMERFFDIEQPEDEIERQLIEIVSANPAVVQYTIMAELQERADDGDGIAAQVLENMKQEMMGNQEGRPKDPNNPEQLTGLQTPTGEPVSQSLGGEVPGRSATDQMRRDVGRAPTLTGD